MISRLCSRETVLMLLTAAGILAAPMRNSQHDAIHQSDLIIVGNVVTVRTVPNGIFVDCYATIRPVRALKGEAENANRDVAVHWQYQPPYDDNVPPNIEGTHALWFLKKGSDAGTYEAMWVSLFQRPMGAYFLPVPAGVPNGNFAAEPGASAQRKIAGELGFAMATIARAEGPRLDVVPRQGRREERPGGLLSAFKVGVATVPRNQAREEFQSLTSLYNELDPSSVRDVNRYLIEQPEIHLRAVGLASELRAGSLDALLMMEKVYAQLPRAEVWPPLSHWMASIDIRGNEAAIRAVGTMCVSNEHLWAFEFDAVPLLARSRSRIAVPYLQALLGHPQEPIRAQAAKGICTAFVSDSALHPLVDTGLIQACSFKTIAANRIGNHSPIMAPLDSENAAELRDWLSAHRSAIQAVTGITPPPTPGWLIN
jgi:hypothetical protein